MNITCIFGFWPNKLFDWLNLPDLLLFDIGGRTFLCGVDLVLIGTISRSVDKQTCNITIKKLLSINCNILLQWITCWRYKLKISISALKYTALHSMLYYTEINNTSILLFFQNITRKTPNIELFNLKCRTCTQKFSVLFQSWSKPVKIT